MGPPTHSFVGSRRPLSRDAGFAQGRWRSSFELRARRKAIHTQNEKEECLVDISGGEVAHRLAHSTPASQTDPCGRAGKRSNPGRLQNSAAKRARASRARYATHGQRLPSSAPLKDLREQEQPILGVVRGGAEIVPPCGPKLGPSLRGLGRGRRRQPG